MPSDFHLDGYELEPNHRLKVPKAGRASIEFAGPEGSYSILVNYLDEHDGQGEAAILVDGAELDRWRFDADDNTLRIRTIRNVKLEPGNRIQVRGQAGGGEYGRIYGMRILGGGPAEPIAHPLGGGRVVVSPDPVSSTEPKTLLRSIGLAADERLRYRVIDPPPELLLNVLDAPGANAAVLHLVNYRFEYGDKFSCPKVVPAKNVVLESQGTAVPPSVMLLTVDSGAQALPVSRRGDAWRVTVPEVGIYAAAVVGEGATER